MRGLGPRLLGATLSVALLTGCATARYLREGPGEEEPERVARLARTLQALQPPAPTEASRLHRVEATVQELLATVRELPALLRELAQRLESHEGRMHELQRAAVEGARRLDQVLQLQVEPHERRLGVLERRLDAGPR